MTGDLLVGVDVGTTRVKAVLLDLAGHELASAAEPTPWLRLPDGSDLDPAELADLVRVLVGRVGDAAAARGARVVGINVARAGRTETYAIPGEAVRELLVTLRKGEDRTKGK